MSQIRESGCFETGRTVRVGRLQFLQAEKIDNYLAMQQGRPHPEAGPILNYLLFGCEE